jgi:hypothetical protein
MARPRIPRSTQTRVIMASRRRCCICYGLERDDARKRGQIAHLDGDPSNNEYENLAYLCLDHHDEYDGGTSQSKGLSYEEVREYRRELYNHFSDWFHDVTREHLLNFLASRISLEDIAQAVVDVASTLYFYGPRHAHDVLTWPELKSTDPEEILYHLVVLDSCVSWGLLTYEEEDILEDGVYQYTILSVNHLPICNEIAQILEKWIAERGETNWQAGIE